MDNFCIPLPVRYHHCRHTNSVLFTTGLDVLPAAQPVVQFGEDRCTQFRVIVVTDPQTNKQTPTHKQTGPITIHCAAKVSAQCNDNANTVDSSGNHLHLFGRHS